MIALVALLWPQNSDSTVAAAPPTREGSPSPTALRQAKWRVRVFPAAVAPQISKEARKKARREGVRASRGIERVYNALFLDHSTVRREIDSHFESRAARAFSRVKIRLPHSLKRVQITYRSVVIGVDARTSRNAIATVRVLAKGVRSSKRVKMQHVSTLWLERIHRSWKILAFQARQGPR
jgi:hypothetical protein